MTGASNYVVSRFMSEELGLKNAELYVYALIYSFTRGGIGEFNGSRQYIATSVGVSVRTVSRALRALLDKGYIERIPKQNRFLTFAYKTKELKVEN